MAKRKLIGTETIAEQTVVVLLEDALRESQLALLDVRFLQEFKHHVIRRSIKSGIMSSGAFYLLFVRTCKGLRLNDPEFTQVSAFFEKLLRQKFTPVEPRFSQDVLRVFTEVDPHVRLRTH